MDLSIIIPTYNEEIYIEKCLKSILSQDFKGLSVEILIADGLSSDKTVEIINEMKDPRIEIIINEMRFQVYALNLLINKAKGKYIIRCDAHAEYEGGYFLTLLNYLEDNLDVGNVGSEVKTVANSKSSKARLIAIALSSKYGVGSSHRNANLFNPVEVDTVLFGAWRKEIFDKVGCFDESFVRGQDLEHNIRISKAGLKIVQIAGPKVTYYARDEVTKLFNMMKQYASVKPFIYKKHKIFPSIRAIIPFLFYCLLLCLAFISPGLFLIQLCTYLLFVFFGSYKEIKLNREYRIINVIKLSGLFIIQHAGHAYGMLVGWLSSLRGKNIKWKATR